MRFFCTIDRIYKLNQFFNLFLFMQANKLVVLFDLMSDRAT